jgi:hypothetical protein
MMSEQNHDSEIEKQLEQLAAKAGEFIEPALYRSSFNLYGELRQKAKRERRLLHYVLGTFHQMDQAQYLFEFETMRERAIELIALLESEDQCRKIQPDMPIQLFEGLVYQFSSCAYENLAEATGQMEGYNSEGLQACIADGLQICRQTGKLACVGCFREYSCDVYMAADDAEIAQHQCNLVLDQSAPQSSRGDRRWLARSKIAWMTFLEGRTQTAIEMYREALELSRSDEVSLKVESQLRTLYALDSLLILTGQPQQMPRDPVMTKHPPAGECLMFDMSRALNESLAAVMEKNWGLASELLTHWDRELQERRGLHLWFEVRLRLIAVKLLAGLHKQADRLADQLQQRARDANDWLTLRRLTALQDPDLPVSPLAAYGRDVGTGGSDGMAPVSPETGAATISPAEEQEVVTPHRDRLLEIGQLFQTIREDEVVADLAHIRNELRSIETSSVTHYVDACAMINMMGVAVGDGADAADLWTWANQLAKNFQENPGVLSMLGEFGNRLRFGVNEEFGKTITADRLEPLFRKALRLQDAGPGTNMRAGDHYLAEQNFGEAERCYARSFRLHRSNGDVAVKLAALYRDTDRPRDALHVLDVCLREGADTPQVAWEAAITAFALKRYEVMLTYLDRYQSELQGTEPWIDYYRAIGLLETGQAGNALEAIDREHAIIKQEALHIDVIRGVALAKLERHAESKRAFASVLETKLFEINYLSPAGIGALLGRASKACREELGDDQLAWQLEQRMLQAYLAGEELFDRERETHEPQDEVSFFQCLVRQSLDENWMNFPGRLAHEEEDAEFYLGTWGVLAESEEVAHQLVLQWQSRCYSGEAEIVDTTPAEGSYRDVPGVVWQGQRMFPSADEWEEDDTNDETDGDFLEN